MAIYLDEDRVGTDPTLIGFPRLILCMGVVALLKDGSLVGAHVSNATSEKAVLYLMHRDIQANGSGIDQLYCMADVDEHKGMDVNGKAAALGFTGTGYLADFGYLDPPNDGTYGEVRSNGPGRPASVRCKLNKNMDYRRFASPTGGASVSFAKFSNYMPNKMVSDRTNTSSAAPNDGFMNTPFLKPVTIS